MLYRITFPAGFEPLVTTLIRRDFPGSTIEGSQEDRSSCIVEIPQTIPVKKPAYAQGWAPVLDSFAAPSFLGACEILSHRLSPEFLRTKELMNRAQKGYSIRSFVVRSFDRGQPTAMPLGVRKKVERYFIQLWKTLPDSQRPDLEVNLHFRSDHRAQVILQQRDRRETEPPKGALPPSTTRLVLELSEPQGDDILLDPFMGSGSIPLERARMGPFSMIFAGDRDGALVESFKKKLGEPPWNSKRRTIFPKVLDGLDLRGFEEGFLTKIVTDPPWGHWEPMDDGALRRFYTQFFKEAGRTLRTGGSMVALTGREIPIETAMEDSEAPWKLEENFEVLISGRKARLVKIRKI